MKKQEIFSLIQLFLAPVLVILLGLLLLIDPDSASVLISRILGAALTLTAAVTAVFALFSQQRRMPKLISAGVMFICAGVLTSNPLLLASFAGRVVGILLVADGVSDMFNAHRRGVRFRMPLLVTVLGAVLVLMPMTASRLVFGLCGLAVTVVGIFMLLDRMRRRLPEGDSDPNIIDAL